MLAVVLEKIITAFAEPRARTHYDIAAARLIGRHAEVNGPISDELVERDFLYAAPPMPGESGIVDDAATTDIDSMVPISATEHDETSSWHPLSTQVRCRHVSLTG